MNRQAVRHGPDKAISGFFTWRTALDVRGHEPWIIFSDQHKGAGDGADEFRLCKDTYLAALRHYNSTGFTLVLLGDVEELWENKFTEVLAAYRDVLEAEAAFGAKRYLRVWGNHDDRWMEEQNRFGVIWFGGVDLPSQDAALRGKHDLIMYNWASAQEKMMLIVGHTHRPVWAGRTKEEQHQPGSVPSYFNTGCCKFADGDITGMEIQDGVLRLIRWKTTGGMSSRTKLQEAPLLELFAQLP